MLALKLPALSRPLEILCLGAHSDDLEIGCGGTILRWLSEGQLVVRWIVWGCSPTRAAEARQSAAALLAGAVRSDVRIHEFRDGFFPYVGADIKEKFEQLKTEISPDVIFTHTRGDLHQDHRLINELTWNTFRDHLILEYEIIKYDGDLGSPNLLVPLGADIAERKIRHIMSAFATQREKRWFTEDTFRALLRVRGVEAGVQYAEAFHCRKGIVGL